ncbi:hypothetical protein V5799_023185 [Amblyomma americanum]|uniref:Uncharacterized protein n=1 Tax=Amblyomma americanum TaxID=6943 RepID=A0AAQ4FID5_AMBAM
MKQFFSVIARSNTPPVAEDDDFADDARASAVAAPSSSHVKPIPNGHCKNGCAYASVQAFQVLPHVITLPLQRALLLLGAQYRHGFLFSHMRA